MPFDIRPHLLPILRWLIGSLTALLLTLPALEGFGAPAGQRPDGGPARICQGYCDDADAATHPGAPQLCDGKNDDGLDPS